MWPGRHRYLCFPSCVKGVNYLVYRLTWDAEKNKFQKKPTRLDGSALQEKETPPLTTDRAVAESGVAAEPAWYGGAWHDGLALGLMLTESDHTFFIDLDEAVVAGSLTPEGAALVGPLVAAGAYFEPSSSGRGGHVLGHYTGVLPTHSNRRPAVHKHEFYVRDRGCVLHPDYHQGSWDVDCTQQLLALLPIWFPPRNEGVDLIPVGNGPRPEWRGPADDDQLLQRALTASGSAAARLGGKMTLATLWSGQCEHNSEADMALAAHLAFWTGCDPDRMERLMRRSGLYRPEKWDVHSSYLRQLTIEQACATTSTVYQEPVRVDMVAKMMGGLPGPVQDLTPVNTGVDWHEVQEKAIQTINNCGTYRELSDTVIPSLRDTGFPEYFVERVVVTLKRKLDLFDSPISVTKLRAMVSSPIDRSQPGAPLQAPTWMSSICYVTTKDLFYDYAKGAVYSHEAFRMEYSRLMPTKATTGDREDPVKWAREKWNVPTVGGIEYRPDQDSTFSFAGVQYVNSFRPNTMPTPAEPSTEAAECIALMQQHLWHIVGQRESLYWALLRWLAHNVQKPGHKIRWSPLIKGVQGDGKSVLGDLLFAAMGDSNVKITSPSTIANSGGFTDWARGACVNLIEEIRLEGKGKRSLYNVMKTLIGDTRMDLNRKGVSSGGVMVNVMNHAAFTNYGDAMPVENGERRWCIIFTPWQSAAEAAAIKGLVDVGDGNALPRFFKRLGASMRSEPGAWRGWLMGVDISSFDPDGRAPSSDEREAMMNASGDFVEQTVQDCIARGGLGVHPEAFCSSELMSKVHTAMGEKPDHRSWNRILTDLGYRQFSTPLWWNGKTRRIWTKSAQTKEKIQEILTSTSR